MKVDIACFTDRGHALGRRLHSFFEKCGDEATLARCGEDTQTAGEWTRKRFNLAGALIFIGAAGIAVRCIAPHLADKTEDPAVLVVDDQGKFVISLLSGHIGGANALARRVAEMLQATPVITTATDGAKLFAVDEWAENHGLAIANPDRIKTVSSMLLAGQTIRVHSAFVTSPPPPGLELTDTAADAHLVIDIRNPGQPAALWLIPPAVVAGIGCRQGTPAEAIEKAIDALCRRETIAPESIAKLCSIDLKRGEPGILEFCQKRNLPFETFSQEQLAQAKGDFASSEFVESVTGVESVCDRAVVFGGGALITQKTIIDGIALALGLLPYVVPFPAPEED